MLTALYSFLLRRRGGTFPAAVAEEMLATFQEAREDAASRGVFAYLRFGTRELAGVAWPARGGRAAASPGSQRMRWVAACALTGGVIAGVVAYALPARYVSSSTLRLVEPTISERFVTLPGRPDLRRQVARQMQYILSRRTLREMIRSHDLYRAELSRKPVEDVIEDMRRDISLIAAANDTVQITFTYSDPEKTLKVARELMTRVLDSSMRERSEEMKTLALFLSERSDAAAKEWMASMNATKGLQQGSPEWHKATLDLDLARQEYQAARMKLAQARSGEAAVAWKYDATLEILDLPFFPEQELLDRRRVVLTGVIAGVIVGLLLSWLRSMRPADPMLSAPTSA